MGPGGMRQGPDGGTDGWAGVEVLKKNWNMRGPDEFTIVGS